MKIGSVFPSKYLRAADLGGRTVPVTMDVVQVEPLGDDEEKPVLYFAGKAKGLVLNRTNAEVIAAAYGEETDGWIGKPIELYPDKTHFGGRLVDCLRVRVPTPRAQDGDEIPF